MLKEADIHRDDIVNGVFHLFPTRLFETFEIPALSEGCEVTLKRMWGGVGDVCNHKENMVWKGVCVLIKRTLIRVESSCPLPICLLSLPPPLHFFLRTARTGHICIPSPLKSNDHQPVNNACAVPARVAVRRVLSGSIGKSAGKIRVVNE